MERREFVKGLGVAAAAGVFSSAMANAQEHKHDNHNTAKKVERKPFTKQEKALLETTMDCMETGEVCLSHCADNLEAGDTAMAECQRSVMNMLAVCLALFKTASYKSADSKRLKALAKVCADFCRDCAKACEKHAAHHEECKKCMESCKECAKACDEFAK